MCVRWQLGRISGSKESRESRLVRGSANAGREPRLSIRKGESSSLSHLPPLLHTERVRCYRSCRSEILDHPDRGELDAPRDNDGENSIRTHKRAGLRTVAPWKRHRKR